ncbi:MAG: hypothetical protein HY720_12230 [Planctomycetes bacterium]|nr:hypothetical protein [Planctomycetota bacterium]
MSSKRMLVLALLTAFLCLPAFAQSSSSGGSSGPTAGSGSYGDELDKPFVPKPPEPPKEEPKKDEPKKNEEPKEDQVTYFGNKVETKRLLYIIDRSGSMEIRDQNSTVDGSSVIRNPTRLDVAKAETKRSVQGLGPQHEFNVIAFASGSSSYSYGGGFFGWLFGPPRPPAGSTSGNGAVIQWKNSQLVSASDGNKAAAISWVSGLTTTGATDAKSAFQVGFGQKPLPMVMFFLSDGVPNVNGGPSEVRSYVRSTNAGRCAVYTIWIGERDRTAEEFMRGLAQENKGVFSTK